MIINNWYLTSNHTKKSIKKIHTSTPVIVCRRVSAMEALSFNEKAMSKADSPCFWNKKNQQKQQMWMSNLHYFLANIWSHDEFELQPVITAIPLLCFVLVLHDAVVCHHPINWKINMYLIQWILLPSLLKLHQFQV